jgi:uncharacterized protein (TIRG00374 family)
MPCFTLIVQKLYKTGRVGTIGLMKSKIVGFRWIWLMWLAAIPLLAWSLKSTPLKEIFGLLTNLHLAQILVLLGVNLLILLMISLRWQIILHAMGEKIPLTRILSYRLTSFGVSYFTPGPQFGGEPAQVALLTRNHAVNTVSAVSSVYLDKLLEVLVNLLVIVGGMFFALSTDLGKPVFNRNDWIPVLGLGLMPAVHLIALRTKHYPLRWLAEQSGVLQSKRPWVRKLGNLAAEAEHQIAAFLERNPRSLLLAILISFLSWAGMIFEYFLAVRFLGLPLSDAHIMFAFVLSRLAFLAPMPGGLGVLEASQVFAMQAMGLPATSGLALSLWMRARDVLIGLSGLALGGWVLARPLATLQKEI